MLIHTTEINGICIAEVLPLSTSIRTPEDAEEILTACNDRGSHHIILHENNFTPEFFDLATGLAEKILLKFINTNTGLSIVSDTSKIEQKDLQKFINEFSKKVNIHFAANIDEAKQKLVKK